MDEYAKGGGGEPSWNWLARQKAKKEEGGSFDSIYGDWPWRGVYVWSKRHRHFVHGNPGHSLPQFRLTPSHPRCVRVNKSKLWWWRRKFTRCE